MAVLIRDAPPGLTLARYDEGSERMGTTGAWPPEGLIAHIAFGSDGDMRVSEVSESPETLRSFQQQLMPVLQEVGVDNEDDEPQMPEVHFFEGIAWTYPSRSS